MTESLSPERAREVQQDMADALREQGEEVTPTATPAEHVDAATSQSDKKAEEAEKQEEDKKKGAEEGKQEKEKEEEEGEEEEEEVDPEKEELRKQGYQDILGSGAIWKKILRPGDNDERPGQGDLVTLRAELKVDGAVIFQDKEFVVRAGEGDVCQAWDLVIKLMKIGEVAHVLGSSRFDGRKECKEGKIEYTLVLLDSKPAVDIDQLSLQEKLQEGVNKRARCKEWVAMEDNESAARSLKKALEYLKIEGVDESKLGDDDAETFKKIKVERAAVSCNLALIYMKFSKFREARELCDQALECDEKNIKAFYVKGKALLSLNEPEEAAACLTLGAKLDPFNTDLRKLLSECEEKRKAILAKEKEQYKRMVSAMGSSPDVLALERERQEREKREKQEQEENEEKERARKKQLWFWATSVSVLVIAVVAYFAVQYFVGGGAR